MFDTRGRDTANAQKSLMEALDNNRKRYDKQLFSDWVVKVYKKCAMDCITAPLPDDENPGELKEFEKRCATNCIRKHDRGYKLYCNLEDQIFNSYMQTTDIDPQQFYSELNQMTPKEMSAASLTSGTGLQSMAASQ